MGTHLIIAEIRSGKLRQVTFELVQAAEQIKNEGDEVVAVLFGHETKPLAEQLAAYGLDRIHIIEQAELAAYHPELYMHAIAPLIDRIRPDTVLLGHTAAGRDFAPMLAAKLSAGQISDAIAIERIGDAILFTRPLYAGKAFELKRGTRRPLVVTIRPNTIPAAAPRGGSISAAIVEESFTSPPALRTIIKEVVRKAIGKVDLTEAKIVVSGGRGVKSADGFKPLEELAEVLGAAVGASRGACDAGYCDYALQIGQTGKVVTPEVYIACGISGAIQHLAGMSQSRIIIAINKDPEAPIFKVADYGIVGDLFEVVPLLTVELKKALA